MDYGSDRTMLIVIKNISEEEFMVSIATCGFDDERDEAMNKLDAIREIIFKNINKDLNIKLIEWCYHRSRPGSEAISLEEAIKMLFVDNNLDGLQYLKG